MCFFMLRGFWFQDDSYSKHCINMSRRVWSRNPHQQKLNGKLESMCGPQEKFKISGVHLAVTAFQYRLFTVFQGSREGPYCDPDIWLLWSDCSGPEVLGVSGSYIWFCQEDQRLHLYKVYARFCLHLWIFSANAFHVRLLCIFLLHPRLYNCESDSANSQHNSAEQGRCRE